MAILNPSFEDAGVYPGEAEHWTLVAYTSLERIAAFGPIPYQAWEDFERWTEFMEYFGPGDLSVAVFDPLAQNYEDFEEYWDNDTYLFELLPGYIASASFGGKAVEDAEDGWENDTYFMYWSEVSSVAGLFDGEPYEDFERLWNDNQLYAWSWGDVTSETAYFDVGANPYETFEGDWEPAISI